jgi:hypothetical protein
MDKVCAAQRQSTRAQAMPSATPNSKLGWGVPHKERKPARGAQSRERLSTFRSKHRGDSAPLA